MFGVSGVVLHSVGSNVAGFAHCWGVLVGCAKSLTVLGECLGFRWLLGGSEVLGTSGRVFGGVRGVLCVREGELRFCESFGGVGGCLVSKCV